MKYGANMKFRKLSNDEIIDLKDIWNTKFRESRLPPGGIAELWYQTITHFLRHKYDGAEIVLKKVREKEYLVLQHDDLSKEYCSAIMNVMGISEMPELTEHQKLVYMMMATSDERALALELIKS